MGELNEDENVYKILVEGNILFLDLRIIVLMFVDILGLNNV